MFWNGNYTSCHIDTLLGNENVTLFELMEEDAILQECKSQNKKLIEFLVRPSVLNELVNLITEEPPEDIDLRNRYRYASLACEILTSDISILGERISADTALMDKLCSFIDRPPPLNPLLASFFSKAIEMLLAKNFKQDYYTHQMTCLRALEYFKNRPTFLPSLLINIGTSAIMDTLKYLILVDPDVRNNMIEWLQSQGCVEQLIEILCGTHKTVSQCPIKPLPHVFETKSESSVGKRNAEIATALSNSNESESNSKSGQNGSADVEKSKIDRSNNCNNSTKGQGETEKERADKLRRRLLTYQSANAYQVLYDIIQSGELLYREQSIQSNQTQQVESNDSQVQWSDSKNQELENIINLLLESIFTTPMETRQIALINGMQVLIALLNDMTTPRPSQEITDKLQKTEISDVSLSGFAQAAGDIVRNSPFNEDGCEDVKVRQRAAKAVAPHLPLLHQALLVAPTHYMPPCIHIPEPVGEARLSVTRLIPELIKLESVEVAEVIVTLGTLGIMLDMFFKHRWNNFLHSNVERAITLAVFSKVAGHIYLKHLIFECNLIDRLLTAWESNEKKVGIKITRQGYMGHVILMLGELFKLFETDPQLLDNMSAPEELKSRWESFVQNKLKAVLQQHSECLGGCHPAQQAFSDSETKFNEFVEDGFQSNSGYRNPTEIVLDSGEKENDNIELLKDMYMACSQNSMEIEDMDDRNEYWESENNKDRWGQEHFIESLEVCNMILDSHSPWASVAEVVPKSDQSGWADFNYFDSSSADDAATAAVEPLPGESQTDSLKAATPVTQDETVQADAVVETSVTVADEGSLEDIQQNCDDSETRQTGTDKCPPDEENFLGLPILVSGAQTDDPDDAHLAELISILVQRGN